MEIVSARNFRSNQTPILRRALNGETILLSSRIGKFKLTPIEEDSSDLTGRIYDGLCEVRLIESGQAPAKPARNFLDEL